MNTVTAIINPKLVRFRYFTDMLAKWLGVGLAFAIPISNAITTVLSIAMVICCLFSLDKQKIKLIHNLLSYTLLFFIVWYVIAACFSAGTQEDIYQAIRKNIKLLYIPLFIPLFYDNIWKSRVVTGFLAAMGLTVAVVFAKLLGFLPAHLFYPMETVAFKDSIFTGLFVAFSIFILAHICMHKPSYRKIMLPLLIAQIYYLLFIGIGRTGQWIFLSLYILFCWQQFGTNWRKQLGAGVLLVFIIISSSCLPSSFASRQKQAWQEVVRYFLLKNTTSSKDFIAANKTSSMGLRLTFATNSYALIKIKPILGWGPGAFSYAYKNFAPEALTASVNRTNPHNQYLLFLVEVGCLGLLIWILILLLMWSSYLHSIGIYSQLGMGLLLTLSLGCVANSWILDFASTHFFILLSSVFLSYHQSIKPTNRVAN